MVEEFTDVTSSYSCSYYDSENITNYEAYRNNKGCRRNKPSIRETNLSGMSPIIIRAIKSNRFKDVLEKGKKVRFTPNAIVLITIAIKNKDDYIIKAYMINNFKE